ncbi:hypothetical protein CFC21_030929 [Triticum aestivum]|uniref:Late embryogenesis abundant protein LEA-2 subgroup domain-containing protein n=2 Tax=Triticum aestivum TaxID=4565 RepID=A0A9R1EVD4_WHEAT|nr:hypothetical protein CFC21_030929 [Triticum aestivum]
MEPDLEAGASPHAPTVSAKLVVLRLVGLLGLVMLTCVLLAAFMALLQSVNSKSDRYQILRVPTFSVDLAGFDGLDGRTLAPSLSPAFNLTLHGVSNHSSGPSSWVCQERGTVAVSYAGAVLAWGRVPGFCFGEHAHERAGMVALGAGVGLSDELRDRMESERRSRSAEVDVDIVLGWIAEESHYLKRLLSCRVKLDEPSPRPYPCKVLVSYPW